MVRQQGQPQHRLDTAGRPNTLGLRERDLADLLDEFDVVDPDARSKRDFVRWPFRSTSLAITLVHPGGNPTDLRMACRNISRGGISLLHSAFLHPGTKCTVHLPHPTLGQVAVYGQVARCRYRSGMVHEIGVAFAQPLDVRAFIPALRGEMFTLERVDPALLVGSILCIEDAEPSLKMFRQHLSETSVDIATIQSGAAPPRAAFDILAVAHPVCTTAHSRLISEVRRLHHRAALFVVTSHHRETARQAMAALEPDVILVRPISQELLLRAVGEYLIVRPRLRPPSNGTAEGARLCPNVGHIMRHCAARLEELLASRDAAACHALCVQMAGAGPALGLPGVGRLASQIAADIAQTMSVEASAARINSLIAACQRARANAA
jgi:hypothetical protein